jgi:hypothetical protein
VLGPRNHEIKPPKPYTLKIVPSLRCSHLKKASTVRYEQKTSLNNISLFNIFPGGNPRWQLEGGSRQCELHKSKILLRHWSYTWQKKTPRRSKTLTP